MGMSTSVIREITIQAKATGVAEATQALHGLEAAEKGVGTAGAATATITDLNSKKTLSAADAYKRQTLSVVDGARQQDQYARAMKVVNSALNQGIITHSEHAERVGLLKDKYLGASSASGIFGKASGMLEGQIMALSGALSIGSVIAFGKGVFDVTKQLSEQAQQVGVNVEAFQAYQAAFAVNGVDAESGAAIIAKLTKNIGAAKETAGPAREAIAALGLGLSSLSTTEAGISNVAKALLAVEDGNKRAYLETQIFGKSGQKLETTLKDLSQSADVLTDRMRNAGLVTGSSFATAADNAADKWEEAMTRMQKAAVPIVVPIVMHIAEALEGLSSQTRGKAIQQVNQEIWDKFAAGKGDTSDEERQKMIEGKLADWERRVAGSSLRKPYSMSGSIEKDLAAYNRPTGNSWDAAAEQRVLASAQEGARLAHLTTTERAAENEVIQRAGELQTINGVKATEINKTYAASAAYITDHLGKQGLQQYRNLGISKEQGVAAEKIKDTFQLFIEKQNQSVAVSKLSTIEAEKQAAIIKAAQIDQLAHNVLPRNLVQEYGTASKALTGYEGAGAIGRVESGVEAEKSGPLFRQQDDQIRSNVVLLATARGERALELELLKAQNTWTGKTLADEIARLKTLDAQNGAIKLQDEIQNLQDRVRLAGLSGDERERESVIISAINSGLVDQGSIQEANLRRAIAHTTEIERQSKLVDSFGDRAGNVIDTAVFDQKNTKQAVGTMLLDTGKDMFHESFTRPFTDSLTGGLKSAFGIGGKRDGSSELNALYVQTVGGASGAPGVGDMGSLLSKGGFLSNLFNGGGGAGSTSADILGVFSSFAGLFDEGGTIGPGQWGIKSGIPEIIQGGTHGVSVARVASYANSNQSAGGNVVVHGGDMHITVQGNADEKTIAAVGKMFADHQKQLPGIIKGQVVGMVRRQEGPWN